MRILPAILVLSLIYLSSCKPDEGVATTSEDASNSLIDQLTAAISKSGADADTYYQRAQAYYAADRYPEAISDLEQAITIDSLQARYYHLLSDAHLDDLNSRAALQAMVAAGNIFSDRIPTLLKLAELQMILQQYDQSLSTINKIFYLGKEDPETFFLLGLVLREKGDVDGAYNVLKEAVDRDPDLVDAWSILGSIAEEKQDAIALTYYENAVRLNPKSNTAQHNLAYYLQNHGDIPKAIDLYRSIAIRDPQYVPAFLNLGVLYTEIDSLDLALEQFEIVSKIKPQDPTGYYYAGLVHEERGDVDAAKKQYALALRLKSTFEPARDAFERLQK